MRLSFYIFCYFLYIFTRNMWSQMNALRVGLISLKQIIMFCLQSLRGMTVATNQINKPCIIRKFSIPKPKNGATGLQLQVSDLRATRSSSQETEVSNSVLWKDSKFDPLAPKYANWKIQFSDG